MRLTSLLSGPVADLAGYIPDFGFEQYDLHRFSDDQIKETGGYVMTLAEKLRKEGEERGKQEGRLEGLREAIELGMTLKFPGDIEAAMVRINKINDVDTLTEIKQAIKTAKDSSEILARLK